MGVFKLYTADKTIYQFEDSDEMHRGGEGRIFAITSDSRLVAKVYHQNITPISEKQFQYLSKLDKKLFVVPLKLLYDKKNNVAGFLMEYISKEYSPLSTIFSKSFCAKNNIGEQVKRKIAENLIKAIQYAHQNQLVIGDFNQYNILVNNKGDVKLIDTDSYQTPVKKHSGIMLDEIRDYLYQGIISEKSDYFALSILLFYAFTFTHPFKGIHKQFKKISERMQHRIPIFINDPDLKRPKCYQALSDTILQEQYNKLYLKGERFLLSLQGTIQLTGTAQQVGSIDTVEQNNLIIKQILKNEKIQNIQFVKMRGYIETEEKFILFGASTKGLLTQKAEFSKKEYDRVFLTNTNFLLKKDDKLYLRNQQNQLILINNVTIPQDAIVCQFDSVILVIDENYMTKLYCYDIFNESIRNKRTEVLGRSFLFYHGLIQKAGGVNRIFYNPGNDVATIKIEHNIKNIYQQGNVGIIQYIENDKVINRYFKIDGMNPVFASDSMDEIVDFALMKKDAHTEFIFQPADDKILILNSTKFEKISELECHFITQHTKLQYANAGIIAWENDTVYLINKK